MNKEINENEIDFNEVWKTFEKIKIENIKNNDLRKIDDIDWEKIKYFLYGKIKFEDYKKLADTFYEELYELDYLKIIKFTKIKSVDELENWRKLLSIKKNHRESKILNVWFAVYVVLFIILFFALNYFIVIEKWDLFLLTAAFLIIIWVLFDINIQDRKKIGKSSKLIVGYDKFILTKLLTCIYLVFLSISLYLTKDLLMSNYTSYYIALITAVIFIITTLITLFIHELKIYSNKFMNRKNNLISLIDFAIENEKNSEKKEKYLIIRKTITILEFSQENFDFLLNIMSDLIIDLSLIKNDKENDKYDWKFKIDNQTWENYDHYFKK